MFPVQQLKEITDPFLMKKSIDARNQKMLDSLTSVDLLSLSASANFSQVGDYISRAMRHVVKDATDAKASSK